MGKPRKKTTAKVASESQFLETVADVWPLHLKRKPEREIAKLLGVPKTTVHRAIERGRQIYRAAISSEDNQIRVDERRAGLEAILEAAWANYDANPDPATLTICRQCEADLRKMFGDDVIPRQEVEVVGGIQFLPKEQMLEQALAAVAKLEQGK